MGESVHSDFIKQCIIISRFSASHSVLLDEVLQAWRCLHFPVPEDPRVQEYDAHLILHLLAATGSTKAH